MDKNSSLRELGMLGSLGIMFVISTFIGLALGIYLDRKFGTSPWLMIIFLLLGIVSAFFSLYREIKRLVEKENEGPGSAEK